EAFEAAGDPTRFAGQLAEGLEPWAPAKLYRSTRFDADATTLALETGRLDLLLGRSYHQIAMASRSQHRSQDMGRIESLGPRRSRLQLLQSRVDGEKAAGETSLFDGLDTTYAGLLSRLPDGEVRQALSQSLSLYRRELEEGRAALFSDSDELVERLGGALTELRRALALTEDVPSAHALRSFLREDESDLEAALAEGAGVILDAFGSDDLIAPGQTLEVEVQIWNGGHDPVTLRRLGLRTPDGWAIEPVESGEVEVPPGTLSQRHFRLSVPEDAEPTRLYFLRRPRSAGTYVWPEASPERATPLGLPLIEASAELAIAGHVVRRSVEVVDRFADQARGEVRNPLFVVPEVAVSLAPSTVVWPLDRQSPVSLGVSVRGEAEGGVRGRVWLEVPDGWSVEPAVAPFALGGPGRAATLEFEVRPVGRASAGPHYVRAWAETPNGRRYGLGYSVIDYPHIRKNLLFDDAVARIEAFELSVDRDVRVAYVPGAGDAVADAIAVMGVPVEVLDERAVAGGDLSDFDVIVLGIRAYETNPALVADNARFLEWARAGGLLIVQYQQYGFFNGDFSPFPMKAHYPHDRVTDETARVTILSPDHAAFNRPNRIGPSDFDGWVQERGLYFPHEWDARYEPLLEMADPGEDPKRGALLVADYGDGRYVYTGLSLFRQLPAGVPGAYRLLANLLSLGR
ncbi:MAG: NEW3 domain-containing protein, partial [Gemmatimonadales bacterium]